MESISANKSCNKHDPPAAKIPEVINNEPNIFNSGHEANESIIFRGQKEKVINKTSKLDATRGYQQILTNKHQFPKLSKVLKYILSVPASSVPSEEIFKIVGDVYTNKRACVLASKGGKSFVAQQKS